jgi:hypothetical protein
MRYKVLSLSIGVALGAVACSDAVTSRITAPSELSASKNPYTSPGGGQNKVTICHAAGRVGTTHYVEITVGAPAQYAHIDEHGTPQAGHEEDYYTTEGSGCGQGGSVTKTLADVLWINPVTGKMETDPVWAATGQVIIPAPDTRWLEYAIVYSLPTGVRGVITENQTAVCNTLGAAEVNQPGDGTITCSFAYALPAVMSGAGILSWSGVTLSGEVRFHIDITTGGVFCGKRTLINTVTVLLSNGKTLTATKSTPIEFARGTTGTCTRT